MDFLFFFRNWYFDSYDQVVSWILTGGAFWTITIFVFNLIFSIISDFIKRGRH